MRSTTKNRLALCSVVTERAHWAQARPVRRRLVCSTANCVWCSMGAGPSPTPVRDLSGATLATLSDALGHLLTAGEGQ